VSPSSVTPFADPAPVFGVEDPWADDAGLLQAAHDTHVLVRIADDRYAVPLDAITQVQPVPGVTRVPGAPPWLVGVANCRGRVLAIADSRLLMGGRPHPLGSSARLLVVAAEGVEVGLLVDAVLGLLALQGPSVAVPGTIAPQAAALLAGVALADGPVAVVDVEAVVGLRHGAFPTPAG
jgi:chemotaxis signal transduction protein